jgi:hypothetical protein
MIDAAEWQLQVGDALAQEGLHSELRLICARLCLLLPQSTQNDGSESVDCAQIHVLDLVRASVSSEQIKGYQYVHTDFKVSKAKILAYALDIIFATSLTLLEKFSNRL